MRVVRATAVLVLLGFLATPGTSQDSPSQDGPEPAAESAESADGNQTAGTNETDSAEPTGAAVNESTPGGDYDAQVVADPDPNASAPSTMYLEESPEASANASTTSAETSAAGQANATTNVDSGGDVPAVEADAEVQSELKLDVYGLAAIALLQGAEKEISHWGARVSLSTTRDEPWRLCLDQTADAAANCSDADDGDALRACLRDPGIASQFCSRPLPPMQVLAAPPAKESSPPDDDPSEASAPGVQDPSDQDAGSSPAGPRPTAAPVYPSSLDASPITPQVPPAVAETAAFLAVGAATSLTLVAEARRLLVRILQRIGASLLFSRIAHDEVLEHPRRLLLHDYVREHPGVRLLDAQRALGFPVGVFVHHLQRLSSTGHLTIRRIGRRALLFPAAPRTAVPRYASPLQGRVLGALRAQPGLTQREIGRVLEMSERRVSYHVAWLEGQGLVRSERAGTTKRCFAATVPDSM